jgi:hypothetical protein
MICVPCALLLPETLPILPELLLAMLALIIVVPVVLCWVFGLSIKHLAVTSWRRLDRQERERIGQMSVSVVDVTVLLFLEQVREGDTVFRVEVRR